MMNRRKFLSVLGVGMATPFMVTLNSARAESLVGNPYTTGASRINPASLSFDSARVFDLSVASGDPTPSGVILWTHIAASAWRSDEPLYLQVAGDSRFETLVLEANVAAGEIGPGRDYTVKLDLDGLLEAGATYYYRFIYAGTASRTGRCRTAPAPGARLRRLKFGLLTCQDYTNGYYNALTRVATDDSIDFVLHLGDFIYETAGDPRFQDLPFADRTLILPSGGLVSLGLSDYRFLYRSYRSDPNLQLAMEQHTWIMVPDDHETANDCYWDYERDTLGAPDHPFTTDAAYGNDPALLRQLKLDSQRAWAEYVPARVQLNEAASHPHDFLRIYRAFSFGGFVDLFMTENRTYRTAHPCGEGDVLQRYVPLGCTNYNSPDQSMLGLTQRDWLIDGLTGSNATWKLMGNQDYLGRLAITFAGQQIAPLNVDAWDGYAAERDLLSAALRDGDVDNFVVLTGDLHTYMASYVKGDYGNLSPFALDNYLGVEFMTPSVTSANIADGIPDLNLLDDATRTAILQSLSASAVVINNPHIKFFNSTTHGYSTLELTDSYCEWVAYSVNKDVNDPASARTAIARQRKYIGLPYLFKLSTSGF